MSPLSLYRAHLRSWPLSLRTAYMISLREAFSFLDQTQPAVYDRSLAHSFGPHTNPVSQATMLEWRDIQRVAEEKPMIHFPSLYLEFVQLRRMYPSP